MTIEFCQMTDFAGWLEQEIDIRDWKPADLARRAGLDTGLLSNVLNRKRNAGPDTCKAIAWAFHLPIETVYRAAGLLPPQDGDLPDLEEWQYVLSRLPKLDRDELMQIARLKMEQAEDYRVWKERFEAIPAENRDELLRLVESWLTDHGWNKV